MTDPKITTAVANASGDTEERELAPDPQHAAVVVYRTWQAGGWFYAPFPLYVGYPGRWLPEDEYQRLVASQVAR